MVEGWLWREQERKSRRERAESVAAYFACHLLNASGKTFKSRVSVKDLLEPLLGKKPVNKKTDKEYLLEKFGLDGGEQSSQR